MESQVKTFLRLKPNISFVLYMDIYLINFLGMFKEIDFFFNKLN